MEQVGKHHSAFMSNNEELRVIFLPLLLKYFSFDHVLDGATFVYVNVFVRSFSAINDVKMVSLHFHVVAF